MMEVKISMYLTLFLVPVLVFIIGLRVKKNPPKEINKYKGYRTSLSMSSQEAWDYANGRLGGLMIRGALYSLVAGVAGLIILIVSNLPAEGVIFPVIVSVILLIQVVCMIIPTITIEKELKNEVYKK